MSNPPPALLQTQPLQACAGAESQAIPAIVAAATVEVLLHSRAEEAVLYPYLIKARREGEQAPIARSNRCTELLHSAAAQWQQLTTLPAHGPPEPPLPRVQKLGQDGKHFSEHSDKARRRVAAACLELAAAASIVLGDG